MTHHIPPPGHHQNPAWSRTSCMVHSPKTSGSVSPVTRWEGLWYCLAAIATYGSCDAVASVVHQLCTAAWSIRDVRAWEENHQSGHWESCGAWLAGSTGVSIEGAASQSQYVYIYALAYLFIYVFIQYCNHIIFIILKREREKEIQSNEFDLCTKCTNLPHSISWPNTAVLLRLVQAERKIDTVHSLGMDLQLLENSESNAFKSKSIEGSESIFKFFVSLSNLK